MKADAAGANTGAAWPDAFSDLQSALAAAHSGDEIWVAAGTYKPTAGTDRSASFAMKSGVEIYGGFYGTETSREQRDWSANPTILSGEIGAIDSALDNAFHVVKGANDARLDGFVVAAGAASWSQGDTLYGGGMANDGVSPVVENCSFIRNTLSGVYNGDASPAFANCLFSDNAAIEGGAMFNSNASPTLTGCVFTSNTSTWKTGGGAILNKSSSPVISRCAFTSNFAYSGGAISTIDGSPVLSDCVFSNNSAKYYGGALDMEGVGRPSLIGCVFVGNAGAYGGAYYEDRASETAANFSTLANCLFVGNYINRLQIRFGDVLTNRASSVMINCIFTGSWGGYPGLGFYALGDRFPVIVNSILWHSDARKGSSEFSASFSAATFLNCNIRGSGGSGSSWNAALGTDAGGNIDADPAFVSPYSPVGPDGLWRTPDDGLRLLDGSPCINAGDAAQAPVLDILGAPRFNRPDIGAYESNYVSAAASWTFYR